MERLREPLPVEFRQTPETPAIRGSAAQQTAFRHFVERFQAAVTFAQEVRRMDFDPAAKSLWCAVYPTLSSPGAGLAATILDRGPAQVRRLVCILALLDRKRVTKEAHLLAALALWEYSCRSVHYLFGHSTGNGDADKILQALTGGF